MARARDAAMHRLKAVTTTHERLLGMKLTYNEAALSRSTNVRLRDVYGYRRSTVISLAGICSLATKQRLLARSSLTRHPDLVMEDVEEVIAALRPQVDALAATRSPHR
jgi:hypothetical protein